MNPTALLEFFAARKKRNEALVLVAVSDTEGSTYSKTGALMLVDRHGVFRGMLSGGCLEGDLAIRAQQVLDSGRAKTVTYDLGDDDDELWGMGVGCDGLMRMLLLPLVPDDNYSPFDQIAAIWQGDSAGEVRLPLPDGDDLCILVRPPPRLLVLGAGLDAEPVVRFAAELGWRTTICDHRPHYIDNGNFDLAETRVCAPAEEVGQNVDLGGFDAAVVMSHHLVSDRAYLAQLADSDIGYIGLLGPANRRGRLLGDLGSAAQKLAGRLHGPAGLDIGARGPAPIALSIIAEIQQQLAKRQEA